MTGKIISFSYMDKEEQDNKKEKSFTNKKRVIAVIIILIILLGIVVGVYLVRKGSSFFGQARTTEQGSGAVELANSYIFASPLKARAGGERIRLTVFILDSEGRGVSNKQVDVSTTPQLMIYQVQLMTDQVGRAVFDLSATSAGSYNVSASVQNGRLPQSLQLIYE